MRILDVNDNPPKFTESLYEVTVQENTTMGSEVTKVKALSLDSGLNALVTYSLETEDVPFRIDPNFGETETLLCAFFGQTLGFPKVRNFYWVPWVLLVLLFLKLF